MAFLRTFGQISEMIQLVTPNTFLIADSTPLVDLYDMEARWGYTSRGKFRGFKLHTKPMVYTGANPGCSLEYLADKL